MNVKQTHEFMKALNAIVEEKGIDKSIVVEAMEAAMANAYKKNEGISNVKAKVNGDTGEIKLYTYKTVVEEVTNPETEISLEDARKIVDDIQLEETIDTEVKIIPESFGRVAAISAKQIVVQIKIQPIITLLKIIQVIVQLIVHQRMQLIQRREKQK